MRLRLPVLAVALVLAGCREDEPTAEERRADLVAQLADDLVAETDGALTSDDATCVASGLVETVGEERFDEVIDAAAGDDGDADLRDQVIDVFASCDALDPLVDGG